MTAFYHMASEIKPGRGLTTKLTTNIPRRLTNAVDLKCLDPTIFLILPRNLCQHVFARCCDGFCDDHDVPLFVLSLLGSHDGVSLCVVLLNKIRFV